MIGADGPSRTGDNLAEAAFLFAAATGADGDMGIFRNAV